MSQRKDVKWEYRLGGGLRGFIPSLIPATILFAATGGLALWLYKSGNGAYIFPGFFAALAVFLTIYGLYHALFYKILVSREVFYYQTSPFNGVFYTYSEISKAHISAGIQASYLSFNTKKGKTVRFRLDSDDDEAAEFFVKCAESAYRTDEAVAPEKWDHKIDGKEKGGLVGIIFFGAVFVIFTALAVGTIHSSAVIIPLVFGLTAIPALCALAVLLVRYFCFMVCIGKDGFYFRSNPFDGRFYKYSDIKSFRVQLKVSNGRSSGSTYSYYFTFTEKGGKMRKFLFDRSLHELEIDTLKKRIKENTGRRPEPRQGNF